MPRPRKPRYVEFLPNVTYFKPAGVPMATLDEVYLGVDELEALRLKDLEGLDQEECARRMNLAQSTFQRILSAAREKLTRAIVEGKAVRIEGGDFEFVPRTFICPECGWMGERDPRDTVRGGRQAPGATPAGGGAGEQAATFPPAECPECGSTEVRPRWPGRHRRRGAGPGAGPGPGRGRRGRGGHGRGGRRRGE